MVIRLKKDNEYQEGRFGEASSICSYNSEAQKERYQKQKAGIQPEDGVEEEVNKKKDDEENKNVDTKNEKLEETEEENVVKEKNVLEEEKILEEKKIAEEEREIEREEERKKEEKEINFYDRRILISDLYIEAVVRGEDKEIEDYIDPSDSDFTNSEVD